MIGGNSPISYLSTPIFVKKCHDQARLPVQFEGDVGFDIFCVEDVVIAPGKTQLVKTGLMLAETIEPLVLENKIVATPFLKIEGRSGLALKGVFPVGGIIDSQYRGEICVVLFNSTAEAVMCSSGSRVAQFVCYYVMANMGTTSVKFFEKPETQQTARGEKGFGSSGK